MAKRILIVDDEKDMQIYLRTLFKKAGYEVLVASDGAEGLTRAREAKPDLITLAKGLTNGAVPMGAVLVDQAIYSAFMTGPEQAIEFFHGYTYSGHPAAAAAGIASLDVYEEEGLYQRASEMAPVLEDAVHSLKGAPNVIDVRNIGMMAAIELAPRDGVPGLRALDVFRRCFDAGVLIRTTGDSLALTPPLIIDDSQIDQIITTIRDALQAVD